MPDSPSQGGGLRRDICGENVAGGVVSHGDRNMDEVAGKVSGGRVLGDSGAKGLVDT